MDAKVPIVSGSKSPASMAESAWQTTAQSLYECLDGAGTSHGLWNGDSMSEAMNMAIFRSSLRLLTALLSVSLPIAMPAYSLVGWITPAAAQTVSIEIFFEPLAPHGRWLRTSRYGYVWVPARIAADWRPYTYGHWELLAPLWLGVGLR